MEACKEIRRRVIELSHKAGLNGSHVGGCLSCVEILETLYDIANIPDPSGDQRDRIILSKGHAALALYCVLERRGLIDKEELNTFESNGTKFYAHAKRDITKGIEFSGGSLSLGLSFSVGVALALKDKGINNKVYTIIGDGECDEGLVWEAMMAATNFHLDNMTVIVDCNGIQSDDFTSKVMDTSPLCDKFKGFGCDVYDIDGHDRTLIKKVLTCVSSTTKVIVAHTIKGKGVSFVENRPEWHHGVVNDGLYGKAMEELK
jgi:transketolase